MHVPVSEFLGPASWPLGRALLHMGGLGIMFDVVRRQSGGCRRHQRCLRDGHREHGGHLLATAEAVYCLIFRRQSFGRRLQPCGRAGLGATWPARQPRGGLRSGVATDPCDDGLGRMRLARPVGSSRAVAGLPSGHTVHVIVVYAGTNESTIRTAGYGRWRAPPSVTRCLAGPYGILTPWRPI